MRFAGEACGDRDERASAGGGFGPRDFSGSRSLSQNIAEIISIAKVRAQPAK